VVVEHDRDELDARYEGLEQWTLEPHDHDLVVHNDRHRVAAAAALGDVAVSSAVTDDWMTVVIRKAAG